MLSTNNQFLNLLFTGVIALFPLVNPIGSAFMVAPYLAHLCPGDKKAAVGKITLYAFGLCVVSLFTGQYILQLFGISLPVVQLAGGILICKIGWESLSSNDTDDKPTDKSMAQMVPFSNVAGKLFYPVTFPMTTGPGTISVLFTLSAHVAAFGSRQYYVNISAILCAVVIICALVYFFYLNTEKLLSRLGKNVEVIVNKISAFFIFCVGLSIGFTGLKAIYLSWR